MAVMLTLWIGWLILMGLDRRYHGSDVPLAMQGMVSRSSVSGHISSG